jgi:hypothetical protein
MNNHNQLIYIAGYGRSGSTLLERLLQYQPKIQATGELVNFFRNYGPEHLCSCGQPLNECFFWKEIAQKMYEKGHLSRVYSDYAGLQKKREAHWSHGGTLFPNKYQELYSSLMIDFFETLKTTVEINEPIIVDSSKTAYSSYIRASALSRINQFHVKVIHLIRDCRGVVNSVKKGLNRNLEKGKNCDVFLPVARALAGWTFSNHAAEKLKFEVGETNYCLVRYEDLVSDPVKTLQLIQNSFNIDLSYSLKIADALNKGAEIEMPILHQLAGNRMRFEKKMRLTPDNAWTDQLNSKINFFIKISMGPLLKKYGYIR